MLWIQGGVCFVGWVLYGAWLAHTRNKSLLPKRVLASRMGSALCLILGAVVLTGGLAIIARSGGLKDGALVPWAWPAVFALGLAFVHLQAMGAIGLVIAAVGRETRAHGQASLAKEDSE